MLLPRIQVNLVPYSRKVQWEVCISSGYWNLEISKWIARIHLKPSTESSASFLCSDIGATELVRARTKIPVPRIFGYELDDNNEVHAAFVLMGFFHGPSAMDAEGDFEVHRGQIPPARRESFYRKVAGIQVWLFIQHQAFFGTRLICLSCMWK